MSSNRRQTLEDVLRGTSEYLFEIFFLLIAVEKKVIIHDVLFPS